jgi:hypothetical protein
MAGFLVAAGFMSLNQGFIDATRTTALGTAGNSFHEVPATVTELGHRRKSSSRILYVDFKTVTGDAVSTRVFTRGDNDEYAENQEVQVVYVEQMPEAARLVVAPGNPYSMSGRITGAVIGWMTAIFVAWLAVWDARKRSKKSRRKKSGGTRLPKVR